MSLADLLVDRADSTLRAALLGRDGLIDLAIDLDCDGPVAVTGKGDRRHRHGAIIRGRVVSFAADRNLAFVDIGEEMAALLAAGDLRPGLRGQSLGQRLTAGEPVVVQIKREASGTKAAVVTMDLTLPGRWLIHTPMMPGFTVSRRLAEPRQRAELRAKMVSAIAAAPDSCRQGGFIIRAVAATAEAAVVLHEAAALVRMMQTWLAANTGLLPALLYPGLMAPVRVLVDCPMIPVNKIHVEDRVAEAGLRDWAGSFAPDLEDRIVGVRPGVGLFEMADLDGVIHNLTAKRVELPGGGWLMIERTQALWVIDVNGAERGDLAAVNAAAAAVIAKQIRLRNMGGMIIVDFITPNGASARRVLTDRLSALVADDPAGVEVYGMSRLGLMEMTRVRRGPPLQDVVAAQVGWPAA